MNQPTRGEVWLVDLGMVAKVRPALVLSVPAADADRVLGRLSSAQLGQVEAVVRTWLGLDRSEV